MFQKILHQCLYIQTHNLDLLVHLVPQMTKSINPGLLLCKRNISSLVTRQRRD